LAWAVRSGRLDSAGAARRRIRVTADITEFGGDRDLVIEAVPEIEDLKIGCFQALDAIVSERTILATTSSIPVIRLAKATANPERVVGVHFCNPVPVLPLVEIIPSLETASEVTAAVTRFAADTLGKHTITSKDKAGFIVNPQFIPYICAAIRMLETGFAGAEDIDTGMVAGCARPMGPLKLADTIGLDVTLANAESLHAEFGEPHYRTPVLLDAFAAASHQRAAHDWKDGLFDAEVVPVKVPQRKGQPIAVTTDEGIRPNTTTESLAALRPSFPPDGTLTAGSASQLSDGPPPSSSCRKRLLNNTICHGWLRSAPPGKWPAPTRHCIPNPPASSRPPASSTASPPTSTSSRSTNRSPSSVSPQPENSASTPAPAAEIAETLRLEADHRLSPPVTGPLSGLTDVLVHGRPADTSGDSASTRSSACGPRHRLLAGPTQVGFFLRRRLRGIALHDEDTGQAWGDGKLIRGSGVAVMLAVCGRTVSFEGLTGRGCPFCGHG
jgi:3-hydroxybutyryl-CoA dehydrogenase